MEEEEENDKEEEEDRMRWRRERRRFRVDAHTDARGRKGDAKSVECVFSTPPLPGSRSRC